MKNKVWIYTSHSIIRRTLINCLCPYFLITFVNNRYDHELAKQILDYRPIRKHKEGNRCTDNSTQRNPLHSVPPCWCSQFDWERIRNVATGFRGLLAAYSTIAVAWKSKQTYSWEKASYIQYLCPVKGQAKG